MKKNFCFIVVATVFLFCITVLTSCADVTRQTVINELQEKNIALTNELNALKEENDALKMSINFPYNPLLYEEPNGWMWWNATRELFPEYEYDDSGNIFIIKSKADFNAVFTEERRTAYAAIDESLGDPSYPPLLDFDTAFPYGATDFSQKMLMIYVYSGSSTGGFEIKYVETQQSRLYMCYGFPKIEGETRESSDDIVVRILVFELDKIDSVTTGVCLMLN